MTRLLANTCIIMDILKNFTLVTVILQDLRNTNGHIGVTIGFIIMCVAIGFIIMCVAIGFIIMCVTK